MPSLLENNSCSVNKKVDDSITCKSMRGNKITKVVPDEVCGVVIEMNDELVEVDLHEAEDVEQGTVHCVKSGVVGDAVSDFVPPCFTVFGQLLSRLLTKLIWQPPKTILLLLRAVLRLILFTTLKLRLLLLLVKTRRMRYMRVAPLLDLLTENTVVSWVLLLARTLLRRLRQVLSVPR